MTTPAAIDDVVGKLKAYRPTNEWGDGVHHVICDEAAALITSLAKERDEAAEQRDALLSALGWKVGPFRDAGVRKVILEDSAALRPEMVKARGRAQEAEANSAFWQYLAGERVYATQSGLLIRVWEKLKDMRRQSRAATTRADAAEREVAALAWFGTQTNLELFHYSPVYGDDDDQDVQWRVTSVNGGINDREWTVVGRGETPIAAIVSARAALSPVGGV